MCIGFGLFSKRKSKNVRKWNVRMKISEVVTKMQ